MNSRILPALAILISVGIFFGYVQPTWTNPIAATKAVIAYDNQALKASADYIAKQNELASESSAIDKVDSDRLSLFLPNSVDNVQLILEINALAARSGLSLSNIDVFTKAAGTANSAVSNAASADGTLPVARSNPVNSVQLSLTAVGTYGALHAFLTGIEKSARLLDVQDIAVTGSDTGVYTYQMKVRLYWLR